MSTSLHLKDPNDIVDYQINWATWLGSDTIATSTWTVPTGLTQVSETETTTTATIWLSGGTAGELYTVSNRITTAGGRTADQSLQIRVGEL